MAIVRNLNNNNGTESSDTRRKNFRKLIDLGEFQELSAEEQEFIVRNTYSEAGFTRYLYVLENMKHLRKELDIKFDLDKLYYEVALLYREYCTAKTEEAREALKEQLKPKKVSTTEAVVKQEPNNNIVEKKVYLQPIQQEQQTDSSEIGKNMVNGFNIENFIRMEQPSEDVVKFTLQQDKQRLEKASVISGDIKYPDNWSELKQSEKAEYLAKLVEAGKLPPQANPWGNVDNSTKRRMLELYYKFLNYDGQRSMCVFQFTTLRNFLLSPDFRQKMRDLNSLEKDMNNIVLQEVPIAEYAPQSVGIYDMAFMVRCAERAKGILVLINSVPIYNPKIKDWLIKYDIYQIQFGKKYWNPFRKKVTSPEGIYIQNKPRNQQSQQQNQQQSTEVPIMDPVNNNAQQQQ